MDDSTWVGENLRGLTIGGSWIEAIQVVRMMSRLQAIEESGKPETLIGQLADLRIAAPPEWRGLLEDAGMRDLRTGSAGTVLRRFHKLISDGAWRSYEDIAEATGMHHSRVSLAWRRHAPTLGQPEKMKDPVTGIQRYRVVATA